MNWLSITLTDLFDDKSKDLTFTYSNVTFHLRGAEITYRQLNPNDFNNYINLPYLFRFIVNKKLKKTKIPYKPLFCKMQPIYDGAALKKRCPVRSFKQLSFKDFFGGLIDLFEFPGIIEKIEPGYYLGFPNVTYKQNPFSIGFNLKINENLVKQAYEYFHQTLYEKTTIKKSKNICLDI